MMEIADILRPAMPDRAGKMPRFEVPDWVVRLVANFDADIRGNLGELGVVKRADATRGQDASSAATSFRPEDADHRLGPQPDRAGAGLSRKRGLARGMRLVM